MFIDVNSEECTKLYEEAQKFQKSAVVDARKLKKEEKITTVLANGFHETERVTPAGNWVITNPGGEEYAVSEEKFKARYESIGNGKYRAKGVIKAFRNPTGEKVEIIAPWGEKQFGDRDCLFAVALDPQHNITSDRYIIGGEEFIDTYVPYESRIEAV